MCAASAHVSRLPPPNRACNFHCTRLSNRQHSAFGITLEVVTSVRFHSSTFPCAPKHSSELAITFLLRRCCLSAALRHVIGFPDLGLLWRLRLRAKASTINASWHLPLGLPCSHNQTQAKRRRLELPAQLITDLLGLPKRRRIPGFFYVTRFGNNGILPNRAMTWL